MVTRNPEIAPPNSETLVSDSITRRKYQQTMISHGSKVVRRDFTAIHSRFFGVKISVSLGALEEINRCPGQLDKKDR